MRWRTALILISVVVLGGCSGTATGGDPAGVSAGAHGSSAMDLSAGLGPAIDVSTREGVALASLGVVSMATAGGVRWAVGNDVDRDDMLVGTGVWREAADGVGTWFRFGNVGGLAPGPDGRVWVVAGGGLVGFDGERWRRVPSYDLAGRLVVTSDGVVWAASTDGRVLRYDGRLTDSGAPVQCGDQGPVLASDGSVWISGVAWWYPPVQGHRLAGCIAWTAAAPGSWTSVQPADGVAASVLAPGPDDAMWAWLIAATARGDAQEGGVTFRRPSRGLFRYDGSSWTRVEPAPPEGVVTSLVTTGTAVWAVVSPGGWPCERRTAGAVGRPDRLYRLAAGRWQPVAGPVARVLTADPDGSVWVRTCAGATRHLPGAQD